MSVMQRGIILSEHGSNASSQASGHMVRGSDFTVRFALRFTLGAQSGLADHKVHFKQLSHIE